ncbi:MAG: hypothetical protein WD770_01005 [Actinomycetota bacterium]
MVLLAEALRVAAGTVILARDLKRDSWLGFKFARKRRTALSRSVIGSLCGIGAALGAGGILERDIGWVAIGGALILIFQAANYEFAPKPESRKGTKLR